MRTYMRAVREETVGSAVIGVICHSLEGFVIECQRLQAG